MKKIITLCLFIMAAQHSFAQTYAYKPMDLDTSCYWLSDYFYHEGTWVCKGEKLSAITGDTVVGGYKYFRIESYATEQIFTGNFDQFCTGMLSSSSLYVREDTGAKKLVTMNGSTILDFNKKVGDTLYISQKAPFYNPVVDSITVQRINGVDRRLQWAIVSPYTGFIYATIEGIGANYNFPQVDFCEWGALVYTLKCFSKGGKALYPDGATTCPRKPRASLGIAAEPSITRSAYAIEGQQIQWLDAKLLPLKMQVWDITGKVVATNNTTRQIV